MTRFKGKRILVAGGGSSGPGMGNGKAAALLYAREGGQVLVADLNAEAAEETVALIRAEGGSASAFVGDMTQADRAESAVSELVAEGGIDVLHFNIGITVMGGVGAISPDDWQRAFAVNLHSAFHLARAAVQPMTEAGGGAIVMISSLAGIRAGPYSYVAYEASKAALQRMAQSMAREFADRNLRVNVVVPGIIDTPLARALADEGEDPEEVAARRAAAVPMGRQGTPWEVAQAALFLASDEASFITGVLLPVDGGMSI
ncbi:MAG: SDR family NAD(P)-dependent oxidoreductase [Pseudomonadota bacterium]